MKQVSYKVKVPKGMRRKTLSICRYLAKTTEEVGMRAMLDHYFRFYLSDLLTNFALVRSELFPFLNERTMYVCLEDLSKEKARAIETLHQWHNFFFNDNRTATDVDGGVPFNNNKSLKGVVSYSGKHGTSHDDDLRTRLLRTLKEIDETYYGGDVAKIQSMWPCQ